MYFLSLPCQLYASAYVILLYLITLMTLCESASTLYSYLYSIFSFSPSSCCFSSVSSRYSAEQNYIHSNTKCRFFVPEQEALSLAYPPFEESIVLSLQLSVSVVCDMEQANVA